MPNDLPIKVTMYTTATCPYCIRAEQLLRARGVENIEKIRIDEHPERMEEMLLRTGGHKSVPQIFVGLTYVGGCDDLIALDQNHKLMVLLSNNTETT